METVGSEFRFLQLIFFYYAFFIVYRVFYLGIVAVFSREDWYC